MWIRCWLLAQVEGVYLGTRRTPDFMSLQAPTWPRVSPCGPGAGMPTLNVICSLRLLLHVTYLGAVHSAGKRQTSPYQLPLHF